ncbi:hypothetical protein BH09BAC5_BH09BAC5_13870 [soil metagenome]
MRINGNYISQNPITKMKKITQYLSLLFIFSFTPFLIHAQLVNVWKFGNGAGLDFSTPIPTPLPNSGLNILEGSSSICDYGGNLHFYTNGNEVRDRNDVVMPNGSGLSGGTSSTQTMIVPWPGNCSKYFIFQTSDQSQNGDLKYSIVDMCLNNGFGDVIVASKNTFLIGSTSEKVTVVLNNNGTDYWVLVHGLGNANFYVFPVTAAGIGLPVTTTIGSFHATNCMIGPIKASSNGQKIVVENTFCSLVELFDFNPATGVISNANNITASLPGGGNGYYGAEFSPNNQILYLASTWVTSRLLQYDLTTTIQTPLVSTPGNYIYGGLQLGPDGKIYMAYNNQPSLDVVMNPNVSGLGCNYTPAGQALDPGTTSSMGITNFVPSLVNQNSTFPPLAVNIGNDTTVACVGSFSIVLDAGSFCSSQYLWQNGSTSQTIIINAPGTYYVNVTSPCGNGIDSIVVNTSTTPPVVNLNGPVSICAGQSITLIAGGATTYTWPGGQGFTYTNADSANVSPTVNSTYTVIGTDACGSDTAFFTVNVNPNTNAIAPNDTTICAGTSISLTANGTTGYQWGGGSTSTSQTINVSPITTTTYYVSSTAACPGIADTIVVTVLPPVSGSILGPAISCIGESITLFASGGLNYTWLNNVNGNGNSAVVAPLADSTFYVIVSDGVCPDDTVAHSINVTSIYQAAFSAVQQPCSHEIVFLNQTNGGALFTWEFGDGQTMNSTQGSHAYVNTGIYDVTLIVNPNTACSDSITIPIDYESFDIADIWIPNAFTPNNDTKNDFFKLYGPVECHYSHLLIFNRWGQLIWKTDSPMTDFWNGQVKNNIVQEGVYVYRLEGENVKPRIGTVTVIK